MCKALYLPSCVPQFLCEGHSSTLQLNSGSVPHDVLVVPSALPHLDYVPNLSFLVTELGGQISSDFNLKYFSLLILRLCIDFQLHM